MAVKKTCPYCGQDAMSTLSKWTAGPGRPSDCINCGRRVRLSEKAWIALLPFLIAFVVMLAFEDPSARLVIAGIAFVTMSALHLFWVPIVEG